VLKKRVSTASHGLVPRSSSRTRRSTGQLGQLAVRQRALRLSRHATGTTRGVQHSQRLDHRRCACFLPRLQPVYAMSSGGSGKVKAAVPPPAAPATAVPAEKAAHKRKFGPLYEALEAYNFRQVLKLSEKRELASLPLTKVRATLQGSRKGPLVRSLCVYGDHAGPCAFVNRSHSPVAVLPVPPIAGAARSCHDGPGCP
jgi:hypothetical protein